MRELPDREEILSLIDELPRSESVWLDNDKARQEAFNSILSRCDHREMMCLVHTLRDKRTERRLAGKKFHSADERIFREAERILFGEFGYVLGIAPAEVDDFIKNRLEAVAQA